MLDDRSTSTDNTSNTYVKKADAVYLWLRDEILSFRLEPGSFIDKAEICKKLQVSKQPVTSAVTRLEQEGLVEIFPQRGSYVARMRLTQMREAIFVRYALEMASLMAVCDDPSERLLYQLRSNHADQRAALDGLDTPLFRELDVEFHRLIGLSSGMAAVGSQVEVGLAIGRRCLAILPDDSTLGERIWREHGRIVECVANRDGTGAVREIFQHGKTMAKALLDFSAERPELFLS